MSLKDQCATCGHERDTHYRDHQTGERLCCTGLYCDCPHFWDGKGTKPGSKVPKESTSTAPADTKPTIKWPIWP